VNSSTFASTIAQRSCVLLVLLAASCQAPEPRTPPATPAGSPALVAPPTPPIDYRRLNSLLDSGLYALDDDRLTTPIDDCAYDYFKAALALVPDEPRALAGLERIIERYLEMADRAIAREQWTTARTMIGRASIVNPDHPGIAQLNARIDILRRASREQIALDADALANREAEVRAQLVELGRRAKRSNVQVTIIARDDAEGRWIYEQMRDAPGDVRIQAQIERGSPPRIDLVTLPLDTAVGESG
jgi:hypothetical protein